MMDDTNMMDAMLTLLVERSSHDDLLVFDGMYTTTTTSNDEVFVTDGSASESDERYQLSQPQQPQQLPLPLPQPQPQPQLPLLDTSSGALGLDMDDFENIDLDSLKHIEAINLDDIDIGDITNNDNGGSDSDANQRCDTPLMPPTPPRSSASRSRSPSPRYSTTSTSTSSSSASSSSSSDDAKHDAAIYAMFPANVLELLRPDFNQWRKDNNIPKFTNRAMQKRLTVIRRKIHSRLYAKSSREKQTHKVIQETSEFELMKQRMAELEKRDEASQQRIAMLEQRLLTLGQPL